jgi:ATP-dependent DNA helicase DinG
MADGTRAAWVFTSATLSVGEDFAHFTSRLGLADAETLAIPSPFDFETQALLYLPAQLPDPASQAHTGAVVDVSVPLIEASAGGAFVLFTSHRALQRAAQLMRDRWAELADYPLLVQGEAPREQLLRRFRESGNAVLLGTASFWEGVDVKGDALRLVIIEKLPFSSPDDALTKARIEHLKANGGNAFREYQLPEAALALKQGVGRLIRSETDRGVVVICDPRLIDKPYGRVFRASLPPMPVTREGADAEKFLRRIAGTAAVPAGLTRVPEVGEMSDGIA